MTAGSQHHVPAAIPASHIGLLVIVQFLWGGNFVVSKLALEELPPLLFMAMRFGVISLLLLPFLRWHSGQMRYVFSIALAGGALHFGLMILSLDRAGDVAPIAIAIQLGVPFATLLSVIFLKERLGIWRISALAIAFSGIVVIGFDPEVFRYGVALVLATAAAFTWALMAMLMRKVRGVAVYDMQGWIALMTWPVLLVWSLAVEPDPLGTIAQAGVIGWGGLAYTVIAVSLIGHAGLYWIVQRHEITSMAPILLLAPVIGALGGVIVLGDVLTWRMVVGGGMTLAGVLVITLREGRLRRTQAARVDQQA